MAEYTPPEWADINTVTLRGRLGKDPETRSTQSGHQIVNLTVATAERWTDKRTGDKMEKVEWSRVVVKFADVQVNTAMGLKKGDRVLIKGKLVTRKWTDQAGVEKYATEIEVSRFGEIALAPMPEDDRADGARVVSRGKPAAAPTDDFLSDEIPF